MSIAEMYALSVKKENAHSDSIWSCDWGKLTVANQAEGEGHEIVETRY